MVALVSVVSLMSVPTVPVFAVRGRFPLALVQVDVSPIPRVIFVPDPLPPGLLCTITLVPRALGS